MQNLAAQAACLGFGTHRYQYVTELARGGMSTISLAFESNTDEAPRLYAIKRLRPELSVRGAYVAMFLEEAYLAAQLAHPNVIQAYECGCDREGYFIAFEYVHGQAYSAALRRLGRAQFDFRQHLTVLIELLRALEHAHTLRDAHGRPLKVVHRDVSPANVLLGFEGQIKLIDFGIATTGDQALRADMRGKLTYMAPEQALRRSVDARADLYAVGVMLWEAIAGRRRWQGAQEAQILAALESAEPPVAPHAEENSLPKLADEICLRALATDPDRRYASAEEFRHALVELARELEPCPTPAAVGRAIEPHFWPENARIKELIDRTIARNEGWDPGYTPTSIRIVRAEASTARSFERLRVASHSHIEELGQEVPSVTLTAPCMPEVARPSAFKFLILRRPFVLGFAAAVLVFVLALTLAFTLFPS